jgi:dynactin complex subunit
MIRFSLLVTLVARLSLRSLRLLLASLVACHGHKNECIRHTILPHTINKQTNKMKTTNKYAGLECLCIPGINIAYDKHYISKVFSKFGIIKYIAEIPLKTNPQLKRVIIYMVAYRDSPEYQMLKQRFDNGQNIKLFNEGSIHEKTWIWEVKPFDNRSTRFVETYMRKF